MNKFLDVLFTIGVGFIAMVSLGVIATLFKHILSYILDLVVIVLFLGSLFGLGWYVRNLFRR